MNLTDWIGQGQVYLDYTGGNLYPQSLVDKHLACLKKEVYGNPHSVNPSSRLSGKLINKTREEYWNILMHQNTIAYLLKTHPVHCRS